MPSTQNPPIIRPPTKQSSTHKDRLVINWEKLTIISSGALFIIIILVLVYWFFTLRPQVEKQVPVQTEESSNNYVDQQSIELNQFTQDWELVSDNTLDIELKHPPDWSIEINEEPKRFLFIENQSDWDLENYKEIVLISPDYASNKAEDGGEEIKSGSRILIIPFKNSASFSSLDEVNPVKIGARDFEKSIFVGNQKARRIDYTQDTAFYFTEIYILKNGKTLLIIRSYLEGERSIYEEIFNAVVGSLKFTK